MVKIVTRLRNLPPCEAQMDISSEEYDGEYNGDTYPADRLSLTITNLKRMSMDQYYIAQQTYLPDYGTVTQSYQPPPELSIQSHEDEGHEILPAYSSDISLENVFMRKMELQSAVQRADDRNWSRVFVILQGTALTFHKYKSSGVFGTRPEFLDDCPDLPVEGKRGEFLRSYSLHLADAGIAADYIKFVPNAIRVTRC
jgi:hypothetical protein